MHSSHSYISILVLYKKKPGQEKFGNLHLTQVQLRWDLAPFTCSDEFSPHLQTGEDEKCANDFTEEKYLRDPNNCGCAGPRKYHLWKNHGEVKLMHISMTYYCMLKEDSEHVVCLIEKTPSYF